MKTLNRHLFPVLRPKKRCLFALFQPTQNIGKLGSLFIFLIIYFAFFKLKFKNKIVKIHITFPERYSKQIS